MSFLRLVKTTVYRIFSPRSLILEKYRAFKELLEYDHQSHGFMAKLEKIYYEDRSVDFCAVEKTYKDLAHAISSMIDNLIVMAPSSYGELKQAFHRIDSAARSVLVPQKGDDSPPFVLMLEEIASGAERLVGGKAANLGTILRQLKLPVPRGFVVTAAAFHHFCRYNNLEPEIEALLAGLDVESSSSLEAVSSQINRRIREARLPPELEEELFRGYDRLVEGQGSDFNVSMRSSAVGEDSVLSFAGQYRTVLNVGRERLSEVYREVIAGKYSPAALFYRVKNGLLDMETPMAVLGLQMVDARASGILYTRDPVASVSDTIKIYSVWGLGEMLVKGATIPDVLEVTREKICRVVGKEEGRQVSKAVLSGEAGIETVSLDPNETGRVSLDDESAQRLASWGLQLESLFGGAQDVEWCQDRNGRLSLLQSRPLRVDRFPESDSERELPGIPNRILFEGGEKASAGVGAGTVVRVLSPADLEQLPQGAVLVAPATSPKFSRIIDRLSAVVTDVGSVAGHFASIAREWRVPTLVNTQVATQVLEPGETVTVDVDGRRIFAGVVQELLSTSCEWKPFSEETPFKKRLRRVLDCVSPLNLVDPAAPNFVAENCTTAHDILRFAHEKAVEEMFFLGEKGRGKVRGCKKLMSDIPISLYVLDLGSGLRRDAARKRKITLDDIVNLSLKALWKGLTHPAIEWSSSVRHFDWQEFDRVSAGIVSVESQILASFALISADYLNVNIRFGYHFVVLDILCCTTPEKNHISFRFEGGGADFKGRRLRVSFMAQVLEHFGFEVSSEGDMIQAQMWKAPLAASTNRLQMLGRLLGFTRLLDVRLKDEGQVERLAAAFIGMEGGDCGQEPEHNQGLDA